LEQQIGHTWYLDLKYKFKSEGFRFYLAPTKSYQGQHMVCPNTSVHKRFRYHRVTAWRAMYVQILSTATQLYENSKRTCDRWMTKKPLSVIGIVPTWVIYHFLLQACSNSHGLHKLTRKKFPGLYCVFTEIFIHTMSCIYTITNKWNTVIADTLSHAVKVCRE